MFTPLHVRWVVANLTGSALGFGAFGEPGEDVVRHMIPIVLGGLFIGAAIGLMSAHRIAKGRIQLIPPADGREAEARDRRSAQVVFRVVSEPCQIRLKPNSNTIVMTPRAESSSRLFTGSHWTGLIANARPEASCTLPKTLDGQHLQH
jgi:hypothetical protein